jgi:myosin heavy subunit
MKWQRRETKDPSSICLDKKKFTKYRPSNSLPSNEKNANANTATNNAQLVYVRDAHYKWLPARVLSTDGKIAKVVLSIPKDWNQTTVTTKELNLVEERTVNLSEYPNGELPLQNVDYKGELLAKWDMADLRYLHDAAILFNIKKKHSQGIPYTRIGKGGVTVALNPFQVSSTGSKT